MGRARLSRMLRPYIAPPFGTTVIRACTIGESITGRAEMRTANPILPAYASSRLAGTISFAVRGPFTLQLLYDTDADRLRPLFH